MKRNKRFDRMCWQSPLPDSWHGRIVHSDLRKRSKSFKRRLPMRGYRDKVIDKHLTEVKHHERMSALQNKTKTHKKILPFVTEYRPSVPNLKKTIMHKWYLEYLIENQPLLIEIFKDPPIISYKRGK